MRVNILEAKNSLSRLIKSAQAGEDVVIANRGEPVVRLVPVRPQAAKNAQPGSPQAILNWLKHRELSDRSRRSAKEIDAYIQEARDSWD